VYIAADEKIIREHAIRVGLPANRVSAVAGVVGSVERGVVSSGR